MSEFSENEDFESWKSEIPVAIATKGKSTSEVQTENISDIIEKTRNYPVITKTSIEIVSFVAKIQQHLQHLQTL